MYSLYGKTLILARSIVVGIGIFFVIPVLFPKNVAVSAAVVINELFPKPSDETSEWIELYNTGPETVSVEGWKLENSAGDKKQFTFSAGIDIPAGGFYSVSQAVTNISLFNEGDTVNLLDKNNSRADSQGYSSTLGYNTSVGRHVDGSGNWSICTSPTYNGPNSCPPPPPLPTFTPTPTESPTPTATMKDTPPAETITVPPVAVTETIHIPPISTGVISPPHTIPDVSIAGPTAISLAAATFFLGIALTMTILGVGLFFYRRKHSK